MTIRALYEVMCNACGESEHLDAGAVSPKQMRDAAKAKGWKRRRHEGKVLDICPHCLKKLAHAKLPGALLREW